MSSGGVGVPSPSPQGCDATSTLLGHCLRECAPRSPPRQTREPAPTQGRSVRSQPSRPAAARPSGLPYYLDKTSRSSSADSSRSRVLFPHAAPGPPPGRSFSPTEDAAMLLPGPQKACAQLRAGEEAGSVGERVTEEGRRRLARAPPVGRKVHCGRGRERHLLGRRGLVGFKPENRWA